MYLHSNMVRLKVSASSFDVIVTSYLHSNMVRLKDKSTSGFEHSLNVFTFQYGSIKSKRGETTCRTWKIYIPIWFD